MPKNTTKFWRNLRREKLNNTNCLGPVRFALFGLGDSSYPKFNWAARKLRVRLLQLGASEFLAPGEGDERHDNGYVLRLVNSLGTKPLLFFEQRFIHSPPQ